MNDKVAARERELIREYQESGSLVDRLASGRELRAFYEQNPECTNSPVASPPTLEAWDAEFGPEAPHETPAASHLRSAKSLNQLARNWKAFLTAGRPAQDRHWTVLNRFVRWLPGRLQTEDFGDWLEQLNSVDARGPWQRGWLTLQAMAWLSRNTVCYFFESLGKGRRSI